MAVDPKNLIIKLGNEGDKIGVAIASKIAAEDNRMNSGQMLLVGETALYLMVQAMVSLNLPDSTIQAIIRETGDEAQKLTRELLSKR